tara:strand:+ start:142 stop:522 length:381 start_codon:yes stop_codon:yes gene_type:complete
MNAYRPHMMTKVRSEAIRKEAEGKPCTLRISSFYPGYTCSSEETTVLVHLDDVGGQSTASKVTDIAGCFGCGQCHDILSGVDIKARDYIRDTYPLALGHRIYTALVETQAMLMDSNLLIVPDGELI